MRIQQLSVFLENKPGHLCEMTDLLAQNNIDISAISIADTSGFGIVRMIVDRPDDAKEVLAKAGIVCKVTFVTALAMNDEPGELAQILRYLADRRINVEYMYAFVSARSGKALLVVQTDDPENTEIVLDQRGLNTLSPADIYRI